MTVFHLFDSVLSANVTVEEKILCKISVAYEQIMQMMVCSATKQ